MAHKITYGPQDFRVNDDQDIEAVIESIQQAINGGGVRWVQLPDTHNTRILITPGIPVTVSKVIDRKPRSYVM